MCLNRGRSKGEDCGHVHRFKPPSEILFTDRSKAVLLSWFIFVIRSSSLNVCVAYILLVWIAILATLWESNCPFGVLLVMFPLGSSYFVFVFLSLWCLWWKVWDNCIDSWLLPSLLFYICLNVYFKKKWSLPSSRAGSTRHGGFCWARLIQQTTNWFFFLFFPRKQAKTFYANCLQSRQCQNMFSDKKN